MPREEDMGQPINPRKYRLRVHYMNEPTFEDKFVFAYSAEDAIFQMKHFLGSPTFHRISYVGPVNPDCKCLNECRCGVEAK